MELRFAFLGGDARMAYAQDVVAAKGHTIVPWQEATHLVLPQPAFESPGRVKGGPTVNELLPHLPGKTVLGGSIGVQGGYLLSKAARIVDYGQDEDLAAGNAEITAEGALALGLEALRTTLAGSPVLVIGWGRIGKLLARKLQALGAKVTVAARKPRDLGLLGVLGFRPERTGVYARGLSGYRLIFNTVPAEILTPEQAKMLSPSCRYVELASRPGVLPDSLSSGQYVEGRGLPGKFAPETAGILLGRTILRLAT